MSQFITCAIAGIGRIGSTLEKDPLREKPASHAGAIVAHPRTTLVAGADPDPDKRREFASHWKGVTTYSDPQAMIQDKRPDIFHIASWTESHPALLEMALHEKVPVIVCEKPLANSIRAVRKVVKAAHHASSRIVMNHERRFSQDYRSVRSSIVERRFGDLLSVSTRLYMGRSRPAEKILYHDGTHMLDILRYLTGQELIINHVLGDPRGEGGGLDIFGTAGATTIHMEVAGGRDHLEFLLDLSFSSGRIRIGNGIYEIWESAESPYYTGFRSLEKKQDGWPNPTGYFSGMMEHAVQLVEDDSVENESSLDDGYAVLQVIRKILKKRGKGKSRIY